MATQTEPAKPLAKPSPTAWHVNWYACTRCEQPTFAQTACPRCGSPVAVRKGKR